MDEHKSLYSLLTAHDLHSHCQEKMKHRAQMLTKTWRPNSNIFGWIIRSDNGSRDSSSYTMTQLSTVCKLHPSGFDWPIIREVNFLVSDHSSLLSSLQLVIHHKLWLNSNNVRDISDKHTVTECKNWGELFFFVCVFVINAFKKLLHAKWQRRQINVYNCT